MPSPNNINKSIPAIPVDGNKRQASAVMLPIVNGSGTIVNYLPIKCTDNGDGTATLDVGLALNGEIDIGNVNLLDTSNAKINPATEDTLAEIKTAIDEINADIDATLSSRATESTLGQVKTNLDDVKTKLDTLNAKDFATQATLAEIKTAIDDINSDIDATISSRATESTLGQVKTNLDDIKTKLDTLNAKDFATQATLNALKVLFDNADAKISAGSVPSVGNTSVASLGVGGVFTGTAEDVSKYSHISVLVSASHASATDGLVLEFSSNGTNFDHQRTYSIPANTGRIFTVGALAKYFRIRYTNGAVAQSYFRLATTYSTFIQKEVNHRSQDTIPSDYNAELVKAILMGLDNTGIFRNLRADSVGRLLISSDVATPADTTGVTITALTSINSNADTLYTITNGKKLTIQLLESGAQENTTGGSRVTLYEDPNGDLSVLNLISTIYVNGNSYQNTVSEEYVGNGTRRIVMRRSVFAGASREVYGRWKGFEQ